MATQRLDQDMVVIKVKGLESLTEETPLGMDDPYKILNKSFWVRTVGVASLHKQMLARNKYLRVRWELYNAHRRRKEWQLWKRLLKGQERYR